MQSKEEYITSIIEKHSDMVYRLALARCASIENAEDIFQEVFLKFSEKLPKFNSEEHEKAWLIRVTINLTKNLNKSSWVRNTVELDENFVGETETKDENEVFDKVMNLPQEYRTVIYLFYYEGYKVKEISEMMNKTEGTIKTWLFRAREQLKNELEGGFGDE
jgi:RNA polymerase sigma-70 factor (ECF subfamily)